MSLLLIAPLTAIPLLMRNGSRQTPMTLDQSLTNEHRCPCCSYVLLRHIRLDGVYWRCSHCHEEMPAWS